MLQQGGAAGQRGTNASASTTKPLLVLRSEPPLPVFCMPFPIPPAWSDISMLRLSVLRILAGEKGLPAPQLLTHSEQVKQMTVQGWRLKMLELIQVQAGSQREDVDDQVELGLPLEDNHNCSALEHGDEVVVRLRPGYSIADLQLPDLGPNHDYSVNLNDTDTIYRIPECQVTRPSEPSSYSSSIQANPTANYQAHHYPDYRHNGYRVVVAKGVGNGVARRPPATEAPSSALPPIVTNATSDAVIDAHTLAQLKGLARSKGRAGDEARARLAELGHGIPSPKTTSKPKKRMPKVNGAAPLRLSSGVPEPASGSYSWLPPSQQPIAPKFGSSFLANSAQKVRKPARSSSVPQVSSMPEAPAASAAAPYGMNQRSAFVPSSMQTNAPTSYPLTTGHAMPGAATYPYPAVPPPAQRPAGGMYAPLPTELPPVPQAPAGAQLPTASLPVRPEAHAEPASAKAMPRSALQQDRNTQSQLGQMSAPVSAKPRTKKKKARKSSALSTFFATLKSNDSAVTSQLFTPIYSAPFLGTSTQDRLTRQKLAGLIKGSQKPHETMSSVPPPAEATAAATAPPVATTYGRDPDTDVAQRFSAARLDDTLPAVPSYDEPPMQQVQGHGQSFPAHVPQSLQNVPSENSTPFTPHGAQRAYPAGPSQFPSSYSSYRPDVRGSNAGVSQGPDPYAQMYAAPSASTRAEQSRMPIASSGNLHTHQTYETPQGPPAPQAGHESAANHLFHTSVTGEDVHEADRVQREHHHHHHDAREHAVDTLFHTSMRGREADGMGTPSHHHTHSVKPAPLGQAYASAPGLHHAPGSTQLYGAQPQLESGQGVAGLPVRSSMHTHVPMPSVQPVQQLNQPSQRYVTQAAPVQHHSHENAAEHLFHTSLLGQDVHGMHGPHGLHSQPLDPSSIPLTATRPSHAQVHENVRATSMYSSARDGTARDLQGSSVPSSYTSVPAPTAARAAMYSGKPDMLPGVPRLSEAQVQQHAQPQLQPQPQLQLQRSPTTVTHAWPYAGAAMQAAPPIVPAQYSSARVQPYEGQNVPTLQTPTAQTFAEQAAPTSQRSGNTSEPQRDAKTYETPEGPSAPHAGHENAAEHLFHTSVTGEDVHHADKVQRAHVHGHKGEKESAAERLFNTSVTGENVHDFEAAQRERMHVQSHSSEKAAENLFHTSTTGEEAPGVHTPKHASTLSEWEASYGTPSTFHDTVAERPAVAPAAAPAAATAAATAAPASPAERMGGSTQMPGVHPAIPITTLARVPPSERPSGSAYDMPAYDLRARPQGSIVEDDAPPVPSKSPPAHRMEMAQDLLPPIRKQSDAPPQLDQIKPQEALLHSAQDFLDHLEPGNQSSASASAHDKKLGPHAISLMPYDDMLWLPHTPTLNNDTTTNHLGSVIQHEFGGPAPAPAPALTARSAPTTTYAADAPQLKLAPRVPYEVQSTAPFTQPTTMPTSLGFTPSLQPEQDMPTATTLANNDATKRRATSTQ